MSKKKKAASEPGLFRTLTTDVRKGGLKKSLKQEWHDLKQFYLDDTRKERLKRMGWLRRGLYLTVWLVKSMLLRLTPLRRVLVVVGSFLLFISPTFTYQDGQLIYKHENGVIGGAMILIVLMLELKDKLLAQTELSAGRTVQLALMPDSQPRVSGWDIWMFYRPANDVGGDLLDFQHLHDGRFGIALGDVAGKGLPAALLMAKLQATIRALAPDISDLSELGKQINRIFYRDGLRNRFASLLYLSIHEKSNEIHYLNAGHMSPLIMRDGQLTSPGKGDLAMGLQADSSFTQASIRLEQDHWLLLYSDGLNEAQNPPGEFFGEDRLLQTLSSITPATAGGIGHQILSKVDHFIGEARIQDDLTLVILKRTT